MKKPVDMIPMMYNLILIVGTAYLVFYKDVSGWLFLLTLCFMWS